MILNDISIRLIKLTIFRAFRLLESLASVPIKNDRWLGYSKVWWDLLANKVELKFTSCSSIMKIIKKSDKTLWLTLISSCIAFYYANETSNTVNLIPVKNMNLFSVSKYGDICICIKYLMEVGDGAHFCNKVELRSACGRGQNYVSICSHLEFCPAGPPMLFSQWHLFCCLITCSAVFLKMPRSLPNQSGYVIPWKIGLQPLFWFPELKDPWQWL